MSGVTGDLQSATGLAAFMIGAYGMGDSLFSYLALSPGIQPDGALREPVERLISEEYRKVKKLIESNKEAVIAIAEALILRNELTDIDVDEILARKEAEHPFVNPNKLEERPTLGFSMPRALPEPANGRRNGKAPHRPAIEPVIIPTAARPTAEPPAPSAELGPEAESGDTSETA